MDTEDSPGMAELMERIGRAWARIDDEAAEDAGDISQNLVAQFDLENGFAEDRDRPIQDLYITSAEDLFDRAKLIGVMQIMAEILTISPHAEIDPEASLEACEAYIAQREIDILAITAQLENATGPNSRRDHGWHSSANRALKHKRHDLFTGLRLRQRLMRDAGITSADAETIDAMQAQIDNLQAENARLAQKASQFENQFTQQLGNNAAEKQKRLDMESRLNIHSVAFRRFVQQRDPELFTAAFLAADAAQADFLSCGDFIGTLERHGLPRPESDAPCRGKLSVAA